MAFIRRAQTESGAILACPCYPTLSLRMASRRLLLRCGARSRRSGSAGSAVPRLGGGSPQGSRDRHAPRHRDPAEWSETRIRPTILPCRFSGEGLAPATMAGAAFQMDGPGLWLWALREHMARRTSGSAGRRGGIEPPPAGGEGPARRDSGRDVLPQLPSRPSTWRLSGSGRPSTPGRSTATGSPRAPGSLPRGAPGGPPSGPRTRWRSRCGGGYPRRARRTRSSRWRTSLAPTRTRRSMPASCGARRCSARSTRLSPAWQANPR